MYTSICCRDNIIFLRFIIIILLFLVLLMRVNIQNRHYPLVHPPDYDYLTFLLYLISQLHQEDLK